MKKTHVTTIVPKLEPFDSNYLGRIQGGMLASLVDCTCGSANSNNSNQQTQPNCTCGSANSNENSSRDCTCGSANSNHGALAGHNKLQFA